VNGFTIENITLSTKVADTLDLDHIAKTFPDSKYNPSETPAVIIHKVIPTKSVLMFLSNGSLFCTGAKSVLDAQCIMQTTHRMLQTAGMAVIENPIITIQSLVVSQDLNKKINLRALAKKLGTINVEYNPKQFPGLIYKKDDPKTVVLLFNTGKIVCQGTSMEQVSKAMESIRNELSSLKMI
jgi:transcription initiation factor TFIID TATA-box-binding protein